MDLILKAIETPYNSVDNIITSNAHNVCLLIDRIIDSNLS